MEKHLGQKPAFACITGIEGNNGYLQEGISQRLYLAGMAMQGLLANSYWIEQEKAINYEHTVQISYRLADELLKQEQL